MTHPNLFKPLFLAILAAIMPHLASAHNSMVKNGDNADISAVTVNNNSTLVASATNSNTSNV